MSVLLQFDDKGYQSAQLYYGKLKEKFINNLTTRLQVNSTSLLQEAAKSWEQRILEGGEKDNNKAERDRVLDNIFNSFAEGMLNKGGVQSAISVAKKQLQDYKAKSDKEKQTKAKELAATIQTQLSTTITPEILRKQLIVAIGNQASGANIEERYEALLQKVYTFYNYFLRSAILGKDSYAIFGIPQITLGGLIAEDLEYQNLLKIFNNSPIQITPGGAKKVNNVMTEMDNILSTLQFSDKAFNQQMSTIETIVGQNYMNSQRLLSTIEYFGEQVKTFNLQARNVQGGHLIGSRSDLRDEAIRQGIYTIYDNIKFLGRYANILKSLGPANVLFNTSNGRMWTDDFIKDFRNKGYYLMFKYQSKGRSMVLSSDIVLDYPIGSKGQKFKAYRRVRMR